MSKLGFLFPGQGAQYTGMLKKFRKDYKVVDEVLEEANDTLGFDIKKLIFEGEEKELTQSSNAQPAVVIASYAIFKIYMQEIGITPEYSAGHSLGEISALIMAGGMSFRDGLLFVKKRGAIMYEAFIQKKGNTAVIMDLSEEVVEKAVNDVCSDQTYVALSGYNSPVQFLVAGEPAGMKALMKEIFKLNGQYIPFRMLPMKVDCPLHSKLMSFLETELKEILSSIDFFPLKWKVISNVTGKPYNSHEEIGTNLRLQLMNPVKWRQSMSFFREQGISSFVEIGPNSVLKGMLAEYNTAFDVYSLDIENEISRLKKAAGMDSLGLMEALKLSAVEAASAPNLSSSDPASYTEKVVKPYRKIEDIISRCKNGGKVPEKADVTEALTLLTQVLDAKEIQKPGRELIFKEIFAGSQFIAREFQKVFL